MKHNCTKYGLPLLYNQIQVHCLFSPLDYNLTLLHNLRHNKDDKNLRHKVKTAQQGYNPVYQKFSTEQNILDTNLTHRVTIYIVGLF